MIPRAPSVSTKKPGAKSCAADVVIVTPKSRFGSFKFDAQLERSRAIVRAGPNHPRQDGAAGLLVSKVEGSSCRPRHRGKNQSSMKVDYCCDCGCGFLNRLHIERNASNEARAASPLFRHLSCVLAVREAHDRYSIARRCLR